MSEEEWMKWVEPADDLLRQAYYRILGMISFHAPINESIKAIQYLAETRRGGTVSYWGRTFFPFDPVPFGQFFIVYSWDNVEVYPGLKMNVWIVGSDHTRNTAYLRKQWWRLYIIEAMAKALGLRV